MNRYALLLLTLCLTLQTVNAQEEILLKDYRPKSIYNIPKTVVEKAKLPMKKSGNG